MSCNHRDHCTHCHKKMKRLEKLEAVCKVLVTNNEQFYALKDLPTGFSSFGISGRLLWDVKKTLEGLQDE